MKHLAIFQGDAAEDILSGKKLIESRFSIRLNPPFGQISSGDLVYIKPRGKEIIGQFKVKKVIFYDGLDSDQIAEIREKYGVLIAADDSYWQAHLGAKYGTLIFIGDCFRFITSPIKILKKDLRGWVVLR